MPTPHPGLGLPTSIERSARRRGCGCCAHCQCTGTCVEVEYIPDMATLLSSQSQSRTPTYSRSPSPLPPNFTSATPATQTMQKKDDFLSIAHPGDAVSLSRKTSRNHFVPEAQQPLTPTVPSRRDEALSRSNSTKNGASNDREKDRSTRNRDRDGKASRPASPELLSSPVEQEPVSRRDQAQEEYEASYKTRPSRRHHRRLESDVEIRAQAPSDDEEREEYARGSRRKERNGSRKVKAYDTDGEEVSKEIRRKESRKDKSYEDAEYPREHRRKDRNGSRKERTYEKEVKDAERSRRKQQRDNTDEEARYRQKEAEEAEYEERRGRKADEEKVNRAHSKSRPREPAMQANADTGPDPATNTGHTRTKSRNDTVELLQNDKRTNEYLQSKIDKIGSKRELIKELIKQSTPIPVNQVGKSTAASSVNPNLYNTSVTHVDVPRPIEVHTGDEHKFGSWNAIRKLSVHVASDYGLMLHFLDWSRRNDSNEPLVAFRLEDGEQGSYEKKSGGLFSKKPGPDWLQESHETGAKVKGRLNLGVGIKGPVLYHIDVKRRKVDKFVITGAQDHAPDFKDDPHYGSHDDYRHVYFETPEGRPMKWYLAEPGKLMRLYGRGKEDYGNLYAEARMQKADSKKSRGGKGGGKEVQIFFYDPSHPDQPRQMKKEQEGDRDGSGLDFAFMCASWWCARQTFDESKLVEAHAEVELIENIEKAFEVDLLAGA